MPTTHVEPNSEALLQEIANSLYKARKVVVITGAGISTNSGIPDFRSENGLYSLIQAQFDAAAAEKQNASQESETSDRPPKRLRLDPQDANGKEVSDSELPAATAIDEGKEKDSITVTTPQPKVTSHHGQPSDRPPHFQASPPTLDFSHLRDDRGPGSSPLSSPPPVLLDPYRDSSTSRSSCSGSVSSDSDSEDPSSVSTPFLTSQSSFSSKNTLPNMKGKDLFDAQIWSCPVKTSVFYTFATTLRHKVRAAEPTTSHHFVSVLRDSRKLVRCYTQNIDQLEERVGLATSLELGAGSRYRFSTRKPAGGRQKDADQGQEEDRPSSSQGQKENECPPASQPPASQPEASQDTSSQPAAPNRGVECVFLHGSLAELRCFVCARTASWDDADRQADTLAGRQPTCPHCAGATAAREERGKRALGVGKLRPDIVLYGEEHPHAHLISPLVQHDLSLGPDMLLILGTSMRVHGLKVLVKEFAKAVHDKGGKVVFVNFTKPPDSVWSDVLDFWVQWDCDAWVGDLQNRKPALWLPPGTVLPEEEKAKASKARTSGGGETSKKRADKAADKAADKTADKSEKTADKEKAAEKDNTEKDKSDKTDEPPSSNRRRESDNKGLKALVEAANTVQDQFAIEALSALKKHKVTQMEMRQQQESTGTAEAEMPPPPPPATKTAHKRPMRAPREPKLNPDAKRPASVRDHKNNAAHLVWRIMSNLEVIRNLEREGEKQVPVPAEDKSNAKKRKVTTSLNDQPKAAAGKKPQPDRDSQTPLTVSVSDAGRNVHVPDQGETQADPEADSITAAVKTRKRKRNVTWKMIRGVETRVSLDNNGTEVALPPPHHPHATAVPVNIPFKAPQRQRSKTPQVPQPPAPQQTQLLPPATIPKNRALPKPKPQAPRTRTNSGASIPPHTAIHSTAIFTPKPLANLAVEVVDKYDAGFEETDRLIARYHELASNSQSRASTRASSPQPRQTETPKEHQLPPLNMRNLNNAQTTVPSRGSTVTKGGRKRSKTGPANGLLKLQVLEPKFDTPGPLSENVLSPNVGSPPLGLNGPRGRMGSVHQPQGHNDQENQPPGQGQHGQSSADQQGVCQQQQQQQQQQPVPPHGQPTRNPFFYSDPLASQLSFPPRWGGQAEQQPHPQYQQGPSPANHPLRYWSTPALDMFFRPCMDAPKQPSQEPEQSMGLGIQEPTPAPAPEAENEVDDPWIEAARRVRQRLPMGGDLGAAALAQLAVQGAAVQPALPFSTVLPARGVPARFYTPFQAWQQQRLEEIRQQGPPPEQDGQQQQQYQQAVGTGVAAGLGMAPGSSGSGPGPGQGRWPPGWSAEEQLRQEAAMMLSSMRGSA